MGRLSIRPSLSFHSVLFSRSKSLRAQASVYSFYFYSPGREGLGGGGVVWRVRVLTRFVVVERLFSRIGELDGLFVYIVVYCKNFQ